MRFAVFFNIYSIFYCFFAQANFLKKKRRLKRKYCMGRSPNQKNSSEEDQKVFALTLENTYFHLQPHPRQSRVESRAERER